MNQQHRCLGQQATDTRVRVPKILRADRMPLGFGGENVREPRKRRVKGSKGAQGGTPWRRHTSVVSRVVYRESRPMARITWNNGWIHTPPLRDRYHRAGIKRPCARFPAEYSSSATVCNLTNSSPTRHKSSAICNLTLLIN